MWVDQCRVSCYHSRADCAAFLMITAFSSLAGYIFWAQCCAAARMGQGLLGVATQTPFVDTRFTLFTYHRSLFLQRCTGRPLGPACLGWDFYFCSSGSRGTSLARDGCGTSIITAWKSVIDCYVSQIRELHSAPGCSVHVRVLHGGARPAVETADPWRYADCVAVSDGYLQYAAQRYPPRFLPFPLPFCQSLSPYKARSPPCFFVSYLFLAPQSFRIVCRLPCWCPSSVSSSA